jgi:hypothetical protein
MKQMIRMGKNGNGKKLRKQASRKDIEFDEAEEAKGRNGQHMILYQSLF